MKEVKKCSISGVAFTMDADAYQELENYLDSLKKDLQGYARRSRDRRRHRSPHSRADPHDAGQHPRGRETPDPEYHPPDGLGRGHLRGEFGQKATEEPRIPRRLYRDTENAKLGGVCAGIGKYFDVDPVWIRLGMFLPILLSFLHWIPFMDWTGSMMGNLFGIFVICYVIMWFAVPAARSARQKLEMEASRSPCARSAKKPFGTARRTAT